MLLRVVVTGTRNGRLLQTRLSALVEGGGGLRGINTGIRRTGKKIGSRASFLASTTLGFFSTLRLHQAAYSATMGVKVQMDTIVKSEEDQRQYRALVLDNDLKVLLISDPATDKSAAALDVHVGSMSDPTELPGLAHFCEHMLFMGTKKYPCENEYNKYLSEHGGSSNAYTAADHTNYYFDVAPDAFSGALDRFAQFFVTPLFTEGGVDREVNAVNSEHEKNIQNDYWRLAQLEKSTADPTHDFSKFGTGNKDTLDIIPKEQGINVRDALLEFHAKWYSSNIMALAVLGKESLDELEEMVLSLFSEVENKSVSVPEWARHPFGPEQCRKVGYVVPVKDIRNLYITFPIPDLHPHYKTAPGHYLGHLIGHEGPGSLLSYLKGRGWVNSLVGGQKSGAKGFAFFVVNVDLTEEGIEHVEDIVTAVFQYLNLLKKEGPQQWVFDECRDLSSMTFRFKDKEQPQSYTCGLAEQLHYYPLDEVLCGGYLLSEFKPELINMVLEHLTPESIRIAVVGKALEEKVTCTEKWYGTCYKMECVEEELLQRWRDAGYNDLLQLPSRNEFVPTNFDLYNDPQETNRLPEMISQTPFARVWFKQDDEYKLPKAVVFTELFSPVAYLDPHHTNQLHIFAQLFRDALTEYTYAADLAGLTYSLSNSKYGLTLLVKGYNDKLHVLLEKIMERMTSFTVDPKRFEILKDAYVRGLRNFNADQPHQHVVHYTSLLLAEHGWTKEELLEATNEMTVETVEAFIPRFLSGLHVEMLIHGNMRKESAATLATTLQDQLTSRAHTRPLLPSQLVRQREYQLRDGSSQMYRAENSVHKSSAVETYFQCGMQETHNNMLLELLCQIFAEPAFDELRTKEQLGYIVWCGIRRANGTQGLRIIVQGDRHPEYLTSRIEAFLHKMGDNLEKLPEEDFVRHREALASRRLERPKKLSHLTGNWWAEITSNQYNFDRDALEVAHLRTLTKDDVIDFYKRFVNSTASQRKKLCVQVISMASGGAGHPDTVNRTEPDDGLSLPPPLREPEVITDIPEFKQGLALYPLMRPLIPVSSKPSKSKL
ncbi:insulin-degrading enzyme-like isoform X1 [Portunus trituberculatus]|uniref:insulin-degrading enzyme-like isoform X1 n=1 Tax=Portunus trituberculatus TaxID=210409 RepID=UPI001E1D1D2D|nr:insulin-degrading enzyme-like isoform X1 [Portunus trituberculatus]